MNIPVQDLRGVPFITFDATGKITQHGFCQRMMLSQMVREGETIIEAEGNLFEHYVEDGKVKPREPNPTTIQGQTLSNIPPGSTVQVTDDTGLTDQVNPQFASLEIMVDFPGTYRVEVTSPVRYLSVTFDMVVNAGQ